MFLLNVKMTSSSILEMQRSEWPETLLKVDKKAKHRNRAFVRCARKISARVGV
jgi:hypothetical protein